MNSLASQIVAARRNRLNNWIIDNYEGSRPAFVRKTGINKGELSALLREKPFGEKRARAIEKLAEMPEGYLVNPLLLSEFKGGSSTSAAHAPPSLSADEAELLRHYRRTPAELRPAALAAVKALATQCVRKP